MRDTIQTRHCHPNLNKYIDSFTYALCQKHKLSLSGRQYDPLPERGVRTHHWQEVVVNLIGPWAVKLKDKWYKFKALLCVNMVTNLCSQIIGADMKTSVHLRLTFEQSWLARYSWPKICIHANGGKFNWHEFQKLLLQCQIKDLSTTSKNSQAYALCERMH